MNKEFSYTDRVTTVTVLALGLFVAVRGLYWFVNQQSVLGESEFYNALHVVMPIFSWGVVLLISGTCLILASIFFGQRKINNASLKLVFVGGTAGAIIHFLMASAALFNAINWITPAQFLILTGLLGFIGFLAGVELYVRRK